MIERQQRKDSIMGFTENEMMGYVKYKRKKNAVLKGSKVNDIKEEDLICGLLSPVVHKLNRGLPILPQSAEHKFLLELLQKSNL